MLRYQAETAIQKLEDMGANFEKKEDRFGETKAGYWIDDVFLAIDPIDALNFALGN